MTMFGAMVEVLRDWRRLGPGFAAGGLRRRFTAAQVPLRVGGHTIWVRGRDSDFATLRQTLRDREYALGNPHFSALLGHRYRAILAAGKRPVIVDAGANVGGASLWFAGEYPLASLVAVEPDPGNLQMLRRNLAPLPHAVVAGAAIGSRAGHVETAPCDHSWSVQTHRADHGIPVITIDDAVSMVDNGELFLVKIDIEGFEDDLFAENTGWLDGVAAVYIEPHDWLLPQSRTSRSFQAAFGQRDFAMLINGENLIYINQRG